MMDALLQDLRYALRALGRTPTFTLAAVACFALGIGANATMFGVVDELMFKPPAHVRDPGRVVRLYFTETSSIFGRFTQPNTSYPAFTDLRDGVLTFENVAAFWRSSVDVGRGAGASRASGVLVSASYFPLLGVRPFLGRFFTADEDRPGGAPVAVVGYAFWRQRFAGDTAALGRTLQLRNTLYRIIGVAPDGFTGADLQAVDIWLPVAVAGAATLGAEWLTNRGNFWIETLARLKPGANVAQAAAEATVVVRRAEPAAGNEKDPNAVVELGPIQAARGPRVSGDAKLSLWLAAVSATVLLIACANVANLLLARSLRRRREVAVRLALGAGRGRLARQFVTESMVLALVGAAAAVLVALWVGPLIRAYLLPKDAVVGAVLGPRVLAFAALLAVATGTLSGLLPAFQASRPDLTVALKAGEREGAYQRSRLRAALLVAQTSLTFVLLAGAGLFVRSLRNVLRTDIGLDAPHAMVVDVNVFNLGYPRPQVNALFQRLLERARNVPGVEDAALSLGGPFGSSFGRSFKVPGLDSIPRLKGGGPYVNAVSPEFFGAMGTRILSGRGFSDADREGSAKVAVVSQLMARLIWPRGAALGQCIIVRGDSVCTEVVGIAANQIRYGVTEESSMQYYVPLAQSGPLDFGDRTLWVRTRGDPHLLAGEVQRALAGAAPDLPYVSVRPLEDLVEPQYRPWRLGATAFGLFGGLALVLAAIGLYGVLAYTVVQRTQELGIRIALGAVPRDVFALVVRQGLTVAGIGVGLGVVLALAAGKVLSSLLYGVSPRDPVVLAVATAVLLAAAAVASWLPARRAARVDPVVALRSE
jgi:putative ABC transport system permease protein